jgi:hypothetical protein
MKKSVLSVALLGSLSLAGCATYPDYGYNSNPIGAVLGSVLGGSGNSYNNGYGGYYGMGGPTFQQSAVEGCAYHAQRYGRVNVQNVQQISGDTLRVYGSIDLNNRYERRPFACSFRADGRVTDFDID